MSNELAERRLKDLHDDLLHAAGLVEFATEFAKWEDALEFLHLAQEPTNRVAGRLQDAIRAVERAKADAEALRTIKEGRAP